MLRWRTSACRAVAPAPPPVVRLQHRRLIGDRLRSAKQQPENGEPTRARGNAVLPRTAVALFALGFVDAGYSGDWSRIGAISRDTEELLKVATFVVVPLCVALIFLLSNQSSHDEF